MKGSSFSLHFEKPRGPLRKLVILLADPNNSCSRSSSYLISFHIATAHLSGNKYTLPQDAHRHQQETHPAKAGNESKQEIGVMFSPPHLSSCLMPPSDIRPCKTKRGDS